MHEGSTLDQGEVGFWDVVSVIISFRESTLQYALKATCNPRSLAVISYFGSCLM